MATKIEAYMSMMKNHRKLKEWASMSGSTNYHGMPVALHEHFDEVIKNNFSLLMNELIDLHEAKLKKLASEASAEYASLLKSAGIDPQSFLNQGE